jgi:predicted O-methyltransferase YrrM
VIDLSRARLIDGWMSEPELQWLAERAQEHKCIVELGSMIGRSTRALADNAAGVVYAIDDWYGPREVHILEEDRKKFFNIFLKNMEGLEGKLLTIRANHRHLPSIDFCPDMVFIDGDHDYYSVCEDIKFWHKRLDAGGLICGHDYGLFEGVAKAVDKFFPDAKVVEGTTIWFAYPTTHPLYR